MYEKEISDIITDNLEILESIENDGYRFIDTIGVVDGQLYNMMSIDFEFVKPLDGNKKRLIARAKRRLSDYFTKNSLYKDMTTVQMVPSRNIGNTVVCVNFDLNHI